MEKLKYSTGLKWACYILIPIIVFILILCIGYSIALSELGYQEGKSFYQTDDFTNQYYNAIWYKLNNQDRNYKTLQTDEGKIQFEVASKRYYYRALGDGFEYIILDASGRVYTNIYPIQVEEIKKEMRQKSAYWQYENGNVTTSMQNLQMEFLPMDKIELEGYTIYTSFDETKIAREDTIYYQKLLYDSMEKWGMIPCYWIPVLTAVLLLIAIYLFYAIGHEKKTEEIYLNRFDEWPYEVLEILWGFLISIIVVIAANIAKFSNVAMLSLLVVLYLFGYVITAILGVTTIKRIKAKAFFKSFLVYRIAKWIKQKVLQFYEVIVYHGSISKTITLLYGGFIAISLILACFFFTGIGAILLLGFWIWCWYTLLKYGKQVQKVKEALENIYQGKTDIHLEDKELKGVLKEMVVYINDIAGGFSNAIEQSLKSERLKTELITNVSHDIKTPLTSIINYVDLLKKEDIQNEKVKEYLEILDKKSQRLKKLTEDLVEASKASSGNVTLNMEKIKVTELMKQTLGEFKDRFEEKGLQLEMQLPEKEISILADNKYMYRVIENLYSNITKYALEHSRVYVDVIEEKKKIKIQMKNISKEKLNISAEELMQRFVRGDKARTTEGSGLGLSISKSLVELQKGTFQMTVDGDLFKVELEFDEI